MSGRPLEYKILKFSIDTGIGPMEADLNKMIGWTLRGIAIHREYIFFVFERPRGELL